MISFFSDLLTAYVNHGVPDHEDIEKSMASYRNMHRGNIAEWRENTLIGLGVDGTQLKAVYQKDLQGEPPPELNIPSLIDYGLKVTGRCDLLIFNQKDELLIIGEEKAPNTAAMYYSGGKNQVVKCDYTGGKPKTGYTTQLGSYIYDFYLKNKYLSKGSNYIILDSGASFDEWIHELSFKGDEPEYIDVYHTITEETLKFEWWRIKEGIIQATEKVNELLPKILESKDTDKIYEMLMTVETPCEPGKYECSWAKGKEFCSFYPYCWGGEKPESSQIGCIVGEM